jgi:hypothetical protein
MRPIMKGDRARTSLVAGLALIAAFAQGSNGAEEVPGEPLRVGWALDRRAGLVTGVFPHPIVPGRVALTTDDGVLLTDDSGRTWRALPGAGTDGVGTVNCVLHRPDSFEILYLATEGDGIWLAQGGAPRRIATREDGLASDSVVAVYFYPGGPRYRTLLAVHGEAAPGISRSDDGGASWRVVARGFHVSRLILDRIDRTPLSFYDYRKQTFLMIAARVDAPAVESVWASKGFGEFWTEIMHDALITDAAAGLEEDVSYCATVDAGLYRLVAEWTAVVPTRISPEGREEWASIGATWSVSPGKELLYAYEPRELGLVTSEDGMKTFASHRLGLLVGPHVRDGAVVRANANGTAFFAAVNGYLFVGRPVASPASIRYVSVRPPVVTCASAGYRDALRGIRDAVRSLPRERDAAARAQRMLDDIDRLDDVLSSTELTIEAEVEGADGSAAVTVDLGAVGGPAEVALAGDRSTGGGAEGRSIYRARHELRLGHFLRDGGKDRMGALALWVRARDAGGREARAPALVHVYERREAFVYWKDRRFDVIEKKGEVTLEREESREAAYEGGKCLKLTAGPGPWLVSFGSPSRQMDLSGYFALSLWIRSDAKVGAEINVHLSDRPDKSFPVTTPPVPIVAGGFVRGGGLSSEWRRAVVPLVRLLREARASPAGGQGFQPGLTNCVVFSGEAGVQTTFRIDDVRFIATAEEIGERGGGS